MALRQSVTLVYLGDVDKLDDDFSPLLGCATTQHHALDPLRQTVEQVHRPFQSRIIAQRARYCVLLVILKLSTNEQIKTQLTDIKSESSEGRKRPCAYSFPDARHHVIKEMDRHFSRPQHPHQLVTNKSNCQDDAEPAWTPLRLSTSLVFPGFFVLAATIRFLFLLTQFTRTNFPLISCFFP